MKKLILCSPKKLDNQLIEKLADYLFVIQVNRLSGYAVSILCPSDTDLSTVLRSFFYQHQINFSLQNKQNITRKLFISDMDATMVLGETIDEMAKAFQLSDDFSFITQQAMLGEIDFKTALNKRLLLLKGMDKKEIIQLTKNIEYSLGAKALLTKLNQLDIYSCLVSGGFTLFAEVVAKNLGFDEFCANQLIFDDDNRLQGVCLDNIVDSIRKKETLKSLVKKLQIDEKETIAIGDGANDIEMLKAAGLGIAYHAKPAAREAVCTEIHIGSLEQLIYFL